MSNNSNPYSLDGEQVRDKGTDNGVVRATVIDTLPEIHSVRVNPRGDNAPTLAPVLTPLYGSHMLPQEEERVILLYIAENTPICLGSIYLLDGVTPPDVDSGDILFGNHSGSGVTVKDDGTIRIITEGDKPVNIDVQAAAVNKNTAQTIPNNDTWYKVEWDQVEFDSDGLFNDGNDSITARYGGLYTITASVSYPNPAQNNRYGIGIFVNDELIQRVTQQSSLSVEMTIDVTTQELLSAGDEIDIRVRHNSGSDKNILGSPVTDEFTISREGRAASDI